MTLTPPASEFDTNVGSDLHPSLYNDDLAPLAPEKRRWGAFEIFNVWTNDVQSLAGYTLAAGLFVTAGINGWWVFAAIILAGFFVNWLVNLTGKPSVKYGIPYAVMARSSMGVQGAQFPALIRGVVAMFWYGAQTYFASTAVAMALNAIFGDPDLVPFLGMDLIDWVSYIFVAALQVVLFVGGISWIEKFLNFAGPAVYAVMVFLLVAIWVQAGDRLLPAVGSLFANDDKVGWDAVLAFVGVIGTMIAYFSAVIINFGDFARFSKSEKSMKRGNFLGLPVSLTFFTFLSLFITAGSYIVLQGGEGDPLTNPAEIVGLVGNVFLTIVAAITFVVATVGINLVANFIPPAYDLSNLAPQRISFKAGGYLTAVFGFIIGALWVAVISQIGLPTFVDTLGAILAPLYGVLVADYYLIQRRRLKVADLFTMSPEGRYHYQKGWNVRAIVAVLVAAVFSVAAVWVPVLANLKGFAWVIGAAIGGILYLAVMWNLRPPVEDADTSAVPVVSAAENGA
ncbi:NCS1 family nucleobase:cation symporter-1 [Microbacterium terrae]|uniref:Allantoin permease n=1 Tax=Microbacterium terrae TaxID=69369 RepID=A0A0M2HCB7_9MICO|nr:NCS1 family nucleobase:cation symporter-1 [Microbacterium terrae]KJL44244.1 putative allantoin permease [Microbacterium terrae]MBP1078784.1 NCS1 family nucleobase:cation symporter-1 [Microbacterium terrae]GLJ98185.1 transport-related membrane protein [Microbacterium terrae]